MHSALHGQPQQLHERSGTERAAIALLGMGEDTASEILKNMSADSVSELMSALPNVRNVVENELEQILSGLLSETDHAPLFTDKTSMGRTMEMALGQKRAQQLLTTTESQQHAAALEKLLMLEPKMIFRLLAGEHPQLQTITLACLDAEKSAAVLALMPNREDLVCRLARLSHVPSSSLEAVAGLVDSLSEQDSGSYALNGLGQLAEVLNHMQGNTSESLLEALKSTNESLATEVAALRFTFDHVLELDIDGLRVLVENVDDSVLALAMRGLSIAEKSRFYACMGKRAAAALRDEVDTGAAVRKSKVETARAEVTSTARTLVSDGEIELGGGADELVA